MSDYTADELKKLQDGMVDTALTKLSRWKRMKYLVYSHLKYNIALVYYYAVNKYLSSENIFIKFIMYYISNVLWGIHNFLYTKQFKTLFAGNILYTTYINYELKYTEARYMEYILNKQNRIE